MSDFFFVSHESPKSRVTDEMVDDFLAWARNFEEIISYRKITKSGRKWLIKIRPGVFAASHMTLFLRPDNVVPEELVLTSREALVFGYGIAVAGECRSRHDWTQEDWEAQSQRKREEFDRRQSANTRQERRLEP